jgi:hypothetical protein
MRAPSTDSLGVYKIRTCRQSFKVITVLLFDIFRGVTRVTIPLHLLHREMCFLYTRNTMLRATIHVDVWFQFGTRKSYMVQISP